MATGYGQNHPENGKQEDISAGQENNITRTYRNGLLYSLPGIFADPLAVTTVELETAKNGGFDPVDPARLARARDLKVYKTAVAERVLELCRHSTYECLRHAGKIHDLVKRQKEDKSLHLTVPAVSKELQYQTNLSQSSFLLVIAGVKNYRRQEKKLADARAFFKEYPSKFREFLLFGRSPYAENYLAKKWRVKRTYSRNFLVSARARLDKHLPAVLQLNTSFPVITAEQFKGGCQQVLIEVEGNIKERQSRGELDGRAKAFRNKVRVLEQHADEVIAFLYRPLVIKGHEQPFITGWRALKRRAGEMTTRRTRGGEKTKTRILPGRATRYHSALRAVLTPAAADFEDSPLAVTFQGLGVNATDILTAERCLSRAFHGKKYSEYQAIIKRALPSLEKIERLISEETDKKAKIMLKKQLQGLENTVASQLPPLPLLLVMGSKYVVYRPGPSAVMTRLLRDNGVLPLVIPGCHVSGKKQQVTVFLPAQRKVRDALEHGATLDVLRVHPPTGPTKKVVVDMVLSGPPAAFTATRHLKRIKTVAAPREVLGLDINQPGPHVIAFSNQDPLSRTSPLSVPLLKTCQRLAELKTAKKALHRGRDRYLKKKIAVRRLARIDHDLALLGRRQERLTKAIANHSRVAVGQELLRTGSGVLAVEQLSLDAKGTRGALAEAILSLPDDPTVTLGAVASVNHYYEQHSQDQRVILDTHDPRGSSSVHVDCNGTVNDQPARHGRIKRTTGNYHFAPCQDCGLVLNTHVLAARYLEKLSLERLNHPASSITVP